MLALSTDFVKIWNLSQPVSFALASGPLIDNIDNENNVHYKHTCIFVNLFYGGSGDRR